MARPAIDPQWLKREILEEGKTLRAIGQTLNISSEMVRLYCQKFGISLKEGRKASWYARRLGISELENPNWLLRKKRKNLSISQLARILGVNHIFLRNQIRRLGLDLKEFRRTVPKITKTCSFCGKSFERYSSHLKGELHFCSKVCQGKWLGTLKKD